MAETDLHLLTNQLNKFERLLHSLEKANKEQSLLIELLQNEKSSQIAFAETQKSDINALRSQKIMLESQLEVSKNRNAELESQLLELAEKNNRGIKELARDSFEKDEEFLKIMRELDLLKQENGDLKVSASIYKNLVGNLESSLASLKKNGEKREEEFLRKQEDLEKETWGLRITIKDLNLETDSLKQKLSSLEEELKNREDQLNAKDFELKDLEFKIRDEEIKSYMEKQGLKAELDLAQNQIQENSIKLDEYKEKFVAYDTLIKDKEAFYEEKIGILERYKQEIEQMLEEKKEENTRLYAQFQVGTRKRSSLESLRLPFEQEEDEKTMQKVLDFQMQHSLMKEQNQKYRAELDHIKEELKRKIPLLEIRKKEYDQMLDQYTVLKSKLELSLLSNARLSEDLTTQQKMNEEVKRDNIIAAKTIKDLSDQISVLLFFSEKMRKLINSLDPFYDLSEFSDLKIPIERLRSRLEGRERILIHNIEDLQEKNKYLLNRLNTMDLKEAPQINPIELSELKGKISRFEAEVNEKQKIIDNLQEKIKKLQTLDEVKQLILSRSKSNEKIDSANQDWKGQAVKSTKFYERHEKILEENLVLRKELKRVKIDLIKMSASHDNATSVSAKQEERIKNLLETLNSNKEALLSKEREIQKLSQEKHCLAEDISKQKSEALKLKSKSMELEKRLAFSDEGKAAFEEALSQCMIEKKKYFEGFLQAQREISDNMMHHKADMKALRLENQGILGEKARLKEEFQRREQGWIEERMKFKGRIENQDLLLIQLNKRNQLNTQIINEQNLQILELNQKIGQSYHQSIMEEGVFSGFVHITQQKNVNFEEIKENIETQKNCYECLISKMTEKLAVLEQENLVLQESLKDLESANEDLQMKLQDSLSRIQDLEKEAENPRINNEELELLNEEKEGYLREIQDLNERLQESVKEKAELQASLDQTSEKFEKISEEFKNIQERLKDNETRYEYERNVGQIKEILIQEQQELFKAQLKEISDRNEEKIKENKDLLERLQIREEERKEAGMEIERNPEEAPNEGEEILKLRESLAQMELKLQEKIKEEFVYKTQANQLKKQMEMQIQEVARGKDKEEFNQGADELIHSKDRKISELNLEISEMTKKLSNLEEEKTRFEEANQILSNQLKMKEVEIVLNQKLTKNTPEALEEGEIVKPFKEAEEENLTESEMQTIREIIKDQKLVELLEKCKKILIYQTLETKI